MPTRKPGRQLGRALDEWAKALGRKAVITAPPQLEQAQTATFATRNRVVAILRPRTRAHVQACLRVANRYRVPLYAISGGKNWGYGSRVPTADGCALLDLGGMRRILDFDEDLAYVTVEPGVTFSQLFTLLRRRNSRLTVSVTGSSPEGSLIGNALERGLGSGPYTDQATHVCALEAVLPNGKIIRTGFGRFSGARAAPLHAWGCGPSFDGLFTQSNLGVVTEMTFWLFRAPEFYGALTLALKDETHLATLVDALRVLRLEGTLATPYRIWNDYKVICYDYPYPWKEARGRTPLPATLRRRMRARSRIGAWNVLMHVFASSRAELRAKQAAIRGPLAPLCDQVTFRWLRRTAPDGTIQVPPLFIPNPLHVTSAYWRKPTREGITLDLDADRCGVIWFGPVIPNRGADAVLCGRIIERMVLRRGFEPSIAFRAVGERALHVIAAIVYDRDRTGEDRRAMECHDEVMARLMKDGYFPYRLGVQSMKALPLPSDGSRWLWGTVKAAADPSACLAPGRYQP